MNAVQSLGQSIDHWQALYVAALVVAFASTAAIVTFAFHIQEHKFGLKISNYLYVISSLLAVISTIVIVNKTKSLDVEKDRQSKVVSDAARLQTAQADRDAAAANQKAQEARDKADDVEKENSLLRIELAKQGVKTEGLEVQQQGMAKQMQAAPTLSDEQVKTIAAKLGKFAGSKVFINRNTDVPSARLGSQFQKALNLAHLLGNADNGMIDLGNTYQGVTIVFKQNGHTPPLATAIVDAFNSAGVSATFDARQILPYKQQLDADTIYVCIGPQ